MATGYDIPNIYYERFESETVQHAVVYDKESGDEIQQLRAEIASLLKSARRLAGSVFRKIGAATQEYAAEAQRFVKQTQWVLYGKRQIKNKSRYAKASFIVFVRTPIRNDRFLPCEVPSPAILGDTVRLTATAGEFEPATFAVFAFEDMQDVLVRAGDLRDGAKGISASAVDIRVVKAWYQNGISTIGFRKDRRVLVPELLLKDDDLIRVDYEGKRNLMRSRDDRDRKSVV